MKQNKIANETGFNDGLNGKKYNARQFITSKIIEENVSVMKAYAKGYHAGIAKALINNLQKN